MTGDRSVRSPCKSTCRNAVLPRYSLRHRALREDLDRRELDALLVTHLPNVVYLTGLKSTAGVALVSPDTVRLLVDSRYMTVATRLAESRDATDRFTVIPVNDSYDEAIQAAVSSLGSVRVGVESEHVSLRRWHWLRGQLGETQVTLVPTEGVVEAERIVKDDSEIECFRQAGYMIVEALAGVIDLVRPGRSEREIAAEIDRALSGCGFQDRAFPTIVASGPNSALPHAHPSERCVSAGDLVLLDFGGVHDGYCVDISRTVCVGPASQKAVHLHAAVLEAQQAAVAAVRPGIVAWEIDDTARSTLRRHGLAEAFGHDTGHGLGLEVHEAPRIGRIVQPGSDVTVSSGMVFTVEPGVYVPGLGGVRIEDDVLVTDDGCEVLTDASRALMVS